MSEHVKFTKLKSNLDFTFWSKFAELKIDEFQLDDKSTINIWGQFPFSSHDKEISPLLLDYTSFNKNLEIDKHNTAVAYNGYMINTNTYEAFLRIMPQEVIDSLGECIIKNIISGTALEEPWRLASFLLFSYSDLKKYKFYYWIAYPTPLDIPTFHYKEAPRVANDVFSTSQLEKLYTSFVELNDKLRHYFCVFVSGENHIEIRKLSEGVEFINANLTEQKKLKTDTIIYFAFYDPCKTSEPGWPLRNLLCLLFFHCSEFCCNEYINTLSLRGNKFESSILYSVKCKSDTDQEAIKQSISKSHLVGWERNVNGKMCPNVLHLSNVIDPIKLAEMAVNLNLKLMKWRLVPDLDLEKISNLKCLLLGAGTLGCSVARLLIGWGISHITFVDSCRVSICNTVRQSLYTYDDAVKRKFKATAAKEQLLNIRPNMNVEGVIIEIPMPGHVVGESTLRTTKTSVEVLEELVAEHDVVFLLLDSREARWFPTLLCAAENKIAINAAVGFDCYMVQRHGTRISSDLSSTDMHLKNPTGQDLGCYFCNDVTQPGNSQADRTLDQRCTVSRPGVSKITAGLAVELMVSIMQHPEGINAKPLMGSDKSYFNAADDDTLVGLLGGVPHTIRGSLWGYNMHLTITHKFPSCTACSEPVIAEYRKRGFDFILDACNVPNYLEKISGVEDLLKRPDLDNLFSSMNLSSDDEQQSEPMK